ncbi:hypothetical protein RAC89_14890 [Paenibacillus sp. GD4]|uniref:hypothetical protein n=1 Tax=Paenibacillus sp. GD4 TaxID=3068890 RepID=UPI0027968FD2|nr:hypothetical protein [Paenibacillus sp. GD4]MDQ1911687.1 hypothetical protein [Paenibacillus sp. GD4]
MLNRSKCKEYDPESPLITFAIGSERQRYFPAPARGTSCSSPLPVPAPTVSPGAPAGSDVAFGGVSGSLGAVVAGSLALAGSDAAFAGSCTGCAAGFGVG